MVESNNAINNTVGASISGVTNTLTVTNPSNTASSKARTTITVGGGTAGDPTLNFNVSGVTDWEMGSDNNASDSLKISQSTSLGTNDYWVMTTNGQRTLPAQPLFSAYLGSTVNNVTGDGTDYTIIFDTEDVDIGSNFNTGTGTFTAPITGNYIFFTNVEMGGIVAGNTFAQLRLNSSLRSILGGDYSASAVDTSSNTLTFYACNIIPLTAADTVTISILIAGSGLVNDVISGTPLGTYFSGALLC